MTYSSINLFRFPRRRTSTLLAATLLSAVAVTALPEVAAAAIPQATPGLQKDDRRGDESEDQAKPEPKKSPSRLSPKRTRTKRGRSIEKYSKRADNFVSLFKPVVESASQSVVQVYSGGKQLALGLIVDSDGLIITKASELKGEIKCRMPSGKLLPAEVFGIHSATDLAMLRVKASSLDVVQFARDADLHIGQWVASPLPDQKPLVGIVSVNTREIPASTPFIGIQMDNLEDRVGVRISFIVSKSPADDAGLWVNDVIIKIDSSETPDRDTLRDALGQYDPNERITLTVMRGETEKKIKLTLAEKDKASPLNKRSNQQNSMGSRLSRRRKAFPNALQHDSMLTAKNCGGPLVNLQGQVIGINIARAGRVASYSLPVATIEPVLAELRTGKLAPEIVNKEAIERIDLELKELADRLGNSPDKVSEMQRKMELKKVRREEVNRIVTDGQKRLKQLDDQIAKDSKDLESLEDDIKRSEQVKRRLNENRKLLSTGRR